MAGNLDAIFERIERLAEARALLEVNRSTTYGTPSLKVRTKLFVRLKDERTLVLFCPEMRKTLLMELAPEIYFQTDHYIGYEAVLVRLDKIADDELALRLEDAWRHRAPKAVSAQRPTQAPSS